MLQRRPTTIRESLLRNLLLLIVLTTGSILVVIAVAGTRTVRDLSASLIEKTADRTEAELVRFFGTVTAVLNISKGWADQGLLDPAAPESLNGLFVPILGQIPQLSSMLVADTSGTEYLVLRDPLRPDRWMNRVIPADDVGGRALLREWNDGTDGVSERSVGSKHDPRSRLWFKGALRTNPDSPVHWTEPVILLTTKDPGITASAQSPDPSRPGRTVVVAFDLLLMDISRYTTRLRVSDKGKVFVLAENPDSGELWVVGLPSDPRFQSDAAIRDALVFVPPNLAVADSSAQLIHADDFPVEPLASAVAAWREQAGTVEPIQVQSAGEDWWVGFRPFPLGRNMFWIGVAVPESDFLTEVHRQRNHVAVVAFLAVLGAIWMAVLLARRYGQPLESLSVASNRIRDLDFDDEPPIESGLVEVNHLADAQRQMGSAVRSFMRYVPVGVVRELMRRGEVARIGGQTERLTVMFTDIRGFTSIAESMRPQELAEHMAEYFDAMLEELHAYGATVDKFVGDAIVVFWGAPKADGDQALHSVQASLACLRRLQRENVRWQKAGRPEMPTRFGLAAGAVVVGNLGAADRLAYTVLGHTVNLASRLEGLNKLYGTDILVAESIVASCGDDLAWRRIDRVAMRGKTEAVDIFEPLGLASSVPEDVARFARQYEHALDAYQAKDFAQAAELLRILDRPDDPSVERLVGLCEAYLVRPPQTPWDGVTRLGVG